MPRPDPNEDPRIAAILAQQAMDENQPADFSRNEYEPTLAERQGAAEKLHAAKLAKLAETKRKKGKSK